MSQPERQSIWKTIAELGGYSAAVVSWLLAISGRMPGSYPTTTSVVTIGITSVAVIIWRWRAVRRTRQSQIAHGGTPTPARHPWERRVIALVNRLRDPRGVKKAFLPFRWLAKVILQIGLALTRLVIISFNEL